jgi:hypothetical protein
MPLTTVDQGLLSTNAQYTGFKNRIINGDGAIDQRNAGASVSATNGSYTVDRWNTVSYDAGAQTGKFTVQQNAGSVTPPVGFKYYIGCTSSAATTVSSNGIYALTQYIEGLNVRDLAWGTANAKSVTISFWAYSSLTGNFGGAVQNSDGNYNYPFQYTISSANTWTYLSVTIPGPTAGTWLTTNGVGVILRFGLGGGTSWSEPANAWSISSAYTADNSVNVVSTSGATLYLTGIQFEVGTVATSFDFRDYGRELALCQRYYYRANGVANIATMPRTSVLVSWAPSAAGNGYAATPVTMRSAPTFNSSGLQLRSPNLGSFAATFSGTNGSVDGVQIEASGSSGLTADSSYFVAATGTTSYYELSAEL